MELHDDIDVYEVDISDSEAILKLAEQLDIDVIYDTKQVFSKKQTFLHDDKYKIVSKFDDLIAQCETFLVGRQIPWLFSSPTWHMTLFMRYYSRPGSCVDTYNLMVVAKTKYGYTGQQIERLRYLTNRIAQIEYSKDILSVLLQKKRRASRHNIQQDYSFEINHGLSNYYFLITGGLDIMARIINDVFNLGITSFNAIALEKNDFQEVIQVKKPALARTLKVKKNMDWMKWIKERRNYVAHEAGINHTPLLKEKKKQMTPQELENKVDREMDWSFAKAMLPPQYYQNLRDIVKDQVRLDNDYEEISRDVMVVRSKGTTKLFHPLRDIDYDYKRFIEILSKVEIRLKTRKH